MFYFIYRLFVLLVLISWCILNGWAWFVEGTMGTCNIGFRLLGFLVWGCSMSMLPFILVAPSVRDSGTIAWKKSIPVYCLVPSFVQICVLVYVALDMPTAAGDGDIISVAGIGISIMLNIIILALCGFLNKIARYLRK